MLSFVVEQKYHTSTINFLQFMTLCFKTAKLKFSEMGGTVKFTDLHFIAWCNIVYKDFFSKRFHFFLFTNCQKRAGPLTFLWIWSHNLINSRMVAKAKKGCHLFHFTAVLNEELKLSLLCYRIYKNK